MIFEIPIIGFGTWQLEGDECTQAVRDAIEAGYTHIDTAEIYGNEHDIGKAISDIPRDRLFLTSKVWRTNHSYDRTIAACEESLKKLGISYLDLYLIHWPNKDADISETIRAMRELVSRRMIRAYGVSNFTTAHLEDMREKGLLDGIVANQVEYHPYLNQSELHEYCETHGIRIIAYSPLARGAIHTDPVLNAIATAHGRTPEQVALRWMIQKDIAVIPKARGSHIIENISLDFDLSAIEMASIEAIGIRKRFIDPGFAEWDE